MHLADTFSQNDLQCIQATHVIIFFVSMCVPWEFNPQPFALLMQCSTTEPQERFVIAGINMQFLLWWKGLCFLLFDWHIHSLGEHTAAVHTSEANTSKHTVGSLLSILILKAKSVCHFSVKVSFSNFQTGK